ncbi:hypothetical protein [Streptomyces sp. NPDC056982]|uniref:hypothetical protein n=1 Tax=Streptomyces sp. NPDC056982 TaxID=3345986 RepID=UPI003643089A
MEVLGADGKIDVMTFPSRRSLLAGSAAAGALPAGTGHAAAHTRTRMFSTRDQRLRRVLAYTQTPPAPPEDMTNRVVSVLTS